MALIIVESCGDGSIAAINKGWPGSPGIGGSGRTNNCWVFTTFPLQDTGIRALGANYGTIYFGFSLKMVAPPAVTGDGGRTLRLYDGATLQIYLRTNTDGTLSFVRGDGTVLATSGAGQVVNGSFFIVFTGKIVIDDTVGEVLLKANNVTFITATGLDTKNSANAYVNGVRFVNANSPEYTMSVDDFWLDDSTDRGAMRCGTMIPNGNGDTSQWVGSDGNSTDNYLLVDEVTANGDTDYLKSATVGEVDLVNLGSVASAASYVGVQPYSTGRQDDAIARKYKGLVKSGGTEYEQGEHTVTTTYVAFPETPLMNDPDTGVPWTEAGLNALQIGVKVSV